MTNQELLEQLKKKDETIQELTKQVALLNEQVRYMTNKLFGRSSEKTNFQAGQTSLFDNEESALDDDGDAPYSRNQG